MITNDMITQFGLMSKISTGNALLDLFLCLLLPVLCRQVLPRITDWFSDMLDKLKREKEVFTRFIEYTEHPYRCWYDEEPGKQPSNHLLQLAIVNYINTCPTTRSNVNNLRMADLKLKKRPWTEAQNADDVDEVVTLKDADDSESDSSSCSSDDSDDCCDFDVNTQPPLGAWLDLGNSIRFMRNESNIHNGDDDRKRPSVLHTYMFESTAKDGNAAIESFVQEALALYKKQESAKHDPSRYMYMPVLGGMADAGSKEGAKASGCATYKRYKLSDDKTFASFFHPEKDAIINLVNSFVNKTGKFAIAGYPNKLGFLLYGPPGTGKTSFIKALAQYTKRSIISIPLSKISTNQELVDIMFDQRIQVENSSDSAISLPFSKTIFVMEDVDAASNVVQRRSNVPGAAPTPAMVALAAVAAAAEAEQQELMAAAAAASAAACNSTAIAAGKSCDAPLASAACMPGGGGASGLTIDPSSTQRDAPQLDQDTTKGAGGCATAASIICRKPADEICAPAPPVATSAAATIVGHYHGAAPMAGAADIFSMPALQQQWVTGSPYAVTTSKLFRGDDELNLAGLLNVLDGVVDTPNRIIIMTTNHPEKLDPALIRPGRINRKVYMGRMGFKEALAMVRHYFGAVSQEDEAALRRVFVDDVLSPAALEAACAEHDSVDELVGAIAAAIAEQAHGESFKPC